MRIKIVLLQTKIIQMYCVGMMKLYAHGKDKRILFFMVHLVLVRHTIFQNLPLDSANQNLIQIKLAEKK